MRKPPIILSVMETNTRDQNVPHKTDNCLQRQVAEAGERLRKAIAALLDELAAEGMREQRAIQAALDLSQSATSRLVSCARVTDPLATLARVPGPQGLRKMLRGAARAGVKRECLNNVDAAIRCVENLINEDVGDRDALDSLLSDWVHESRASYELRQKCAAYKAMCALRGVQARVQASCWLIHPTEEPNAYDTVEIEALYGCRRVRPSASMQMLTQNLAPGRQGYTVLGLNGQAVTSVQDIVLPEFSNANLGTMETHQRGILTQTIVRDLPLGKTAGTDLVTAMLFRRLHHGTRSPNDPPTSGVAATAEPPSADLVLDVLLHDEVWSDLKPELRIFDTAVRGSTHPDDPVRQADRFEMLESVVFLGRGTAAFRVAEIPRYVELIEHVCNRFGWDAQRFRGYRCKIRYPVYGSEISLSFPLPVAHNA